VPGLIRVSEVKSTFVGSISVTGSPRFASGPSRGGKGAAPKGAAKGAGGSGMLGTLLAQEADSLNVPTPAALCGLQV